MAIPERKAQEADWLAARLGKQLENEGMVPGTHQKLAKRTVSMNWQALPHTSEIIDGVRQGARNTYWVNPLGEVRFTGHAASDNWRTEGALISNGPWFQLQKESIAALFEDERYAVKLAQESARRAETELEEFKTRVRDVVGCDEYHD